MTKRKTSKSLGGSAGGPSRPEPPVGIWVRASVNYQGLERGQHAYVNPRDPIVRKAIEHTWLVPLPGQEWQQLFDLDQAVSDADDGQVRDFLTD